MSDNSNQDELDELRRRVHGSMEASSTVEDDEAQAQYLRDRVHGSVSLSGGGLTAGGPWDLIFYENRSTPEVVRKGAKGKPKKGWGNQTRRRAANKDETKIINRGDWLRVDQSGKKGGEKGYKKTKIRPQLVSSVED